MGLYIYSKIESIKKKKRILIITADSTPKVPQHRTRFMMWSRRCCPSFSLAVVPTIMIDQDVQVVLKMKNPGSSVRSGLCQIEWRMSKICEVFNLQIRDVNELEMVHSIQEVSRNQLKIYEKLWIICTKSNGFHGLGILWNQILRAWILYLVIIPLLSTM